jgi:hypothetical protein
VAKTVTFFDKEDLALLRKTHRMLAKVATLLDELLETAEIQNNPKMMKSIKQGKHDIKQAE